MEFEDVMDQIEKADVNSNGYVTREELENYLKSENKDLSIVDDWFRWFDLDNKGVICAEDICATLGMPMRQTYAERVSANQKRQSSEVAAPPTNEQSNTESGPEKKVAHRRKHSTSWSDSVELGASKSTDEESTSNSSTNLVIKETKATTEHSTPKYRDANKDGVSTSSSSSIKSNDSLRKGFEILHEEPVDDELLKDVMRIVNDHEDEVQVEKDMAKLLKDGVEVKHGKHWQAIVAYTNLGCNVEHEIRKFIYLRKNNHIYILFRTPIPD